jgi:oxaloacetate decarboxylase
MKWTERRARFRAILEGRQCVRPASVFDPLSARIAEELGYEMAMLGGSIAALAVLGAPDLILLTATEFAEQAYRICRAARLPLMVDADHGYGNALNAAHTIEALEVAGVCGATIEDTLLPAPFGVVGKARLISLEEGVGKMQAAVAGRVDPAFAVIARTSAPIITSFDDTIMRLKSYEAAGADAVLIVGLTTKDQLATVADAVKLPLILGTTSPELEELDLAAYRVRIALQGHLSLTAAVQAVHETLSALRHGTPPDQIKGLASNHLMAVLAHKQRYEDWGRKFLGLGTEPPVRGDRRS